VIAVVMLKKQRRSDTDIKRSERHCNEPMHILI
jgi:hypothetical protein